MGRVPFLDILVRFWWLRTSWSHSFSTPQLKEIPKMNAVELKKKILTGKFSLREKQNGKSPIWGIFREILNESGDLLPQWVACHFCRNVYGYDNRKLGTSNLLKHKCGKGRVLPRSAIDLQDRVIDGCLKFVAKDLRPFDVVTGSGFMDLAETFVKAGSAMKTTSDLAEVFPRRENFYPRLDFFAQRCREQLANEMTQEVCGTGGGIALETWESEGQTYLSVSVHYVKDLAVVARMLSTTKLDRNLLDEEDYLQIQTMQKKSVFGISDWLNNFVYVSTRGLFIQAALKNVHKINCASTPVNDALNYATSFSQPELSSLKLCRDVVTYLSSIKVFENLKIQLLLDAKNHWESTLAMCAAVVDNRGTFQRCLQDTTWEDVIDNLLEKDMVDFIEYLSPFQQALSEMNAEKYPTLYLVYLWHFKFLDHLEPRSSDSQFISVLKERVKERYLDEVEIDLVHKVAVFLHPLLKNLRMVSSEREKLEIYQWVRSRLDEIKRVFGCDKETESERRPTDCPRSSVQGVRRPSILSEALIHFMDTDNVTNHREEDELEQYKRMKLSEVVINGFDLLDWWERQKHQLPNLYVLAKRIFAVPATSAHVSHCFSLPQHVLLERRNHLDVSNMDEILFLNSHYKYT
ncbi:transposable element Hobo transposase [Hetaerina americana]|uniref:transposable element Hobo transposase n=1 Tax=Hetaerina americana TaxID=62018 RepID=UPI003A7F41F8